MTGQDRRGNSIKISAMSLMSWRNCPKGAKEPPSGRASRGAMLSQVVTKAAERAFSQGYGEEFHTDNIEWSGNYLESAGVDPRARGVIVSEVWDVILGNGVGNDAKRVDWLPYRALDNSLLMDLVKAAMKAGCKGKVEAIPYPTWTANPFNAKGGIPDGEVVGAANLELRGEESGSALVWLVPSFGSMRMITHACFGYALADPDIRVGDPGRFGRPPGAVFDLSGYVKQREGSRYTWLDERGSESILRAHIGRAESHLTAFWGDEMDPPEIASSECVRCPIFNTDKCQSSSYLGSLMEVK